MSKFILVTLIALMTFNGAMAKDGKYTIALHITNPLGAYTKYGGGAELRIRQSAWMISSVKYNGIYAGKQFRFEYQKYFKTYKKHENFFYVKLCGGDATYDGSKLSLLDDKTKVIIGPVNYVGGGAGIGRRLNYKHFFLMFNLGAKYMFLPPDFPDEYHERFRYFYSTGPGAIIDLNMRLGFQF